MATINSMVTILSPKSIPKIINSKFGAKVSDRTVNFFSPNVISYQRLKLAKLVSAANLSQIEPDINEDPIGQFELNNIDMEDFKYGYYDGAHTYYEGEVEKGNLWSTMTFYSNSLKLPGLYHRCRCFAWDSAGNKASS